MGGIVAVAYVGVAVALAVHSGQPPLGADAILGSSAVALILHVVIHECGHLLVALLTGLKVAGVQISLFGRRQSWVKVRPNPRQAGLPVRMVAFMLGGPVANLVCAALTYQLALRPMPVVARYVLLVATIAGAVLGSADLLPLRSASGRLRSDGANVLRWTFRSGSARAELDRAQRLVRTGRTVKDIVAGKVDPARLDRIVAEADDPLVLLAAFNRRLTNGVYSDSSQFIADATRLDAVARDERTDPVHAALIAARLVTIFGILYLYSAIVEGKPVNRTDADEIISMAELGVRLRDNWDTRVALAITRLLDHRPAEVRALLVDIRGGGADPATEALALQIRALAEIYLGDHAQADRLVTAAGDVTLIEKMLTALRAPDTTGRLPSLVQPDPEP